MIDLITCKSDVITSIQVFLDLIYSAGETMNNYRWQVGLELFQNFQHSCAGFPLMDKQRFFQLTS